MIIGHGPVQCNGYIKWVPREGLLTVYYLAKYQRSGESQWKDQGHSAGAGRSGTQEEILKDDDFKMKAKVELEILLKSIKS